MIWIESVERPKRTYHVEFNDYNSGRDNWYDIYSILGDMKLDHKTVKTYCSSVPQYIRVSCTSDDWHEFVDLVKEKAAASMRYNRLTVF